MNRQQRRKLEREKAKLLRRAHSGIDFKRLAQSGSIFDATSSIPLELECLSVHVVSSNQRQHFEQQVREFGELIAVYDKTFPPRIEHVIVFKPFPYMSSAEMSKACRTMLFKYSPHNYYVMLAVPPPEGYDGSLSHQKALCYGILKYFRKSERGKTAEKVLRDVICRKIELGIFDEATKMRICRDLKLSKYINK